MSHAPLINLASVAPIRGLGFPSRDGYIITVLIYSRAHDPGWPVSAKSYAAAATRILSEPTTPLFSITDFVSGEPNLSRKALAYASC